MTKPPFKASPASRVRFGAFELSLKTREIHTHGKTVRLQEQPYRVLMLLLERGDEGATREELRTKLWPDDTMVNFERSINAAVRNLRRALHDSSEKPRYIETLPRLGYRLLVPAEWDLESRRPAQSDDRNNIDTSLDQEASAAGTPHGKERAVEHQLQAWLGSVAASPRPGQSSKLVWGTSAAVLVALFVASAAYYQPRRGKPLTDKDTTLISDFTNTTGDSIFDDTLKQGLAAQLEQSPFLQLASDRKVNSTLELMGRKPGERLTPEVAREVCQRMGATAMVTGSIAQLGSQYVVSLKGLNCATGEVLGVAQEQAGGKETVLKALNAAAVTLREELGESHGSLQRYGTPVDEATTPSLEALKAYSLGYRALEVTDYASAIALGKRATQLDPNFAMAYLLQGVSYSSVSETERAAENMLRAYELRGQVSEREKFDIESHYLASVAGNLEDARRAYELWGQVYPRDSVPPGQLGNIYLVMGDYDQALTAYRKAVRLNPESGMEYGNLGTAYTCLNRPREAEAAVQGEAARKVDSTEYHVILYQAAYLRRDAAAMDREKSTLMKIAGWDDQVLDFESDTAAYEGQFFKARILTLQAVDLALRDDEKETAASFEAESAVRDALIGDRDAARRQARAALGLSIARGVQAMAATALALAGDSVQATRLGADLAKHFPQDTMVQLNYIPVIKAAIALRGNPTKALEALAPAERYELGLIQNPANFSGYPLYLRGEAYLATHQGGAAAAEFQKLLDHPGVILNEPIGALAHLGQGRAYIQLGETAKAKDAYQDFLSLWKDADPDLPIYKHAKAEYAALR